MKFQKNCFAVQDNAFSLLNQEKLFMLENQQSLNYQTIPLRHNLKNLNFQMTKQIKNLSLIFHVEIAITYT